jgi:hypothetical protein
VLDVISHWENKDQHYNDISMSTSYSLRHQQKEEAEEEGTHEKKHSWDCKEIRAFIHHWQQCKKGATTLKNILTVSQKVKHRLTM